METVLSHRLKVKLFLYIKLFAHFFANSRKNYEKSCVKRPKYQTSRYHLNITSDRSTVAITIEHWSSVTPKHSETNNNFQIKYI